MYSLAHTVEVNPPGIDPILTREQVWRGLEMKAENALPFVPSMKRCELIDRHDNVIVRDVELDDGVHRERITLYPPMQVHFERVAEAGFIENTISTSDRGLLLTFSFVLNFAGAEPGSAAEREKGDSMRDAYVGAVAATLKRVREMVRDREL